MKRDAVRNNRTQVKIIGICGSPRRKLSRTGLLIRDVLAGARSLVAETEYVDLAALKIGHCNGCNHCHRLGACAQKDDLPSLLEKVMLADGLVLGSPVYIDHVTGLVKNLLDRLVNVIHCQRLSGKYGAVVCTTGGSALQETADYLEQWLRNTGAQTVGRVACQLEDGPIPEDAELRGEARSLGTVLARAIEEGVEFPGQLQEQEREREFIQEFILRNKDQWDWEYRYWKERSWL